MLQVVWQFKFSEIFRNKQKRVVQIWIREVRRFEKDLLFLQKNQLFGLIWKKRGVGSDPTIR